jgi:glycosyltransferase involved in cell wall biosynthesis
MPRYFSLADALLVTLKDEDIFRYTIPSKVQSYLASARPIVASLAGEGARVIEESGSGVTCLPENPDALAQSVLKVYHMQCSERKAMGCKGREYFEKNFERGMLLDQLERIIKDKQGAAECVS